MLKITLSFSLTFITLITAAQNDNQYFQTHHYAFNLNEGFDKNTADALKPKLQQYKIILQAEGGSHYLNFYKQLPVIWIKFLSEAFGLNHFFFEHGHSSDMLINKYFQTGDTAYIYSNDKTIWKSLYAFNSTLPPDKKLKYFGVDFESRRTYVWALKLLLPAAPPPESIKPFVQLIQALPDTLNDCSSLLKINSQLKQGLVNNKKEFIQYLNNSYFNFERIVLNKGDCSDVFKDRNTNMANTFFSFDNYFKGPVYYGELGEAHTILKNHDFASVVNNSENFRNKVCVINLYCYDCSTPQEQPSNWQLNKIEKNILEELLPYCQTDFTLFDFSENNIAAKKFKAYGQFLIIAKNQH